MKPIYQSIHSVDREKGLAGDCYRACVASLLECSLDDVPNFMDGFPNVDEFNVRVETYLRGHGYGRASFAYDGDLLMGGVLAMMAEMARDVYYIFSGQSPRGTDHAVIALNDAIIHDPNRGEPPLVGPLSTGHWLIEILTPMIAPTRKDSR